MHNPLSILIRALLIGAICAICLQTLSACGGSPAPDASSAVASSAAVNLVYPETKRDATVDDYHGQKIADPYRWLENADAPVLIRIDTRTGHGQGRPTAKQIELAVDVLAFIDKSLGMEQSE